MPDAPSLMHPDSRLAYDDMSAARQREIRFLEFWALQVDNTLARCPRRECRRRKTCKADPADPIGTCQGRPSTAIDPLFTGMLLRHFLRDDIVRPILAGTPDIAEDLAALERSCEPDADDLPF